MSLKSFAIITIHKNLLAERIGMQSNYLACKIGKIGYDVCKISALTPKAGLINYEIEESLKQFHFVVLLSDMHQNHVISDCLQRVFNLKSKMNLDNDESNADNTQWKRLKSKRHSIRSIIYLNRLFIIDSAQDIELSFESIMLPYLEYFIASKPYSRLLQLSTAKLNGLIFENVRLHAENDNLLKLIGSDIEAVLEVENRLVDEFSAKAVAINPEFSCDDFKHSMNYANIKEAFDVIVDCFERYGPENVCISFNGGKDCTVLLHLTLAILHEKFPEHKSPMLCLYVQSSYSFTEVNEFIVQAKRYYNLDVMTISKNIKEALTQLLEKMPNLRACLMGTRRTDPFSSHLNKFQMTDENWPQVMRVSPLLDWHYADIWDYLLTFQVPYCSLYDVGYTSLGNVMNTQPNPLLQYFDRKKQRKLFLPAYKLLDESNERTGRR